MLIIVLNAAINCLKLGPKGNNLAGKLTQVLPSGVVKNIPG